MMSIHMINFEVSMENPAAKFKQYLYHYLFLHIYCRLSFFLCYSVPSTLSE